MPGSTLIPPPSNHGASGRVRARCGHSERHNGGVSRNANRKRRRIGTSEPPPPGIRSHLRADGAPKTSYRTRHDALAVADERRQDSGVELNVYQCEFCSAWHMGSTEGREG